MALYHKWDVKNGFAYVLQFNPLISDGLGSVCFLQLFLKCFTESVNKNELLYGPSMMFTGKSPLERPPGGLYRF